MATRFLSGSRLSNRHISFMPPLTYYVIYLLNGEFKSEFITVSGDDKVMNVMARMGVNDDEWLADLHH